MHDVVHRERQRMRAVRRRLRLLVVLFDLLFDDVGFLLAYDVFRLLVFFFAFIVDLFFVSFYRYRYLYLIIIIHFLRFSFDFFLASVFKPSRFVIYLLYSTYEMLIFIVCLYDLKIISLLFLLLFFSTSSSFNFNKDLSIFFF
jgi:hypothetical protein